MKNILSHKLFRARFILVFLGCFLVLSQSAQALTIKEILQGHDDPQPMVLGASTSIIADSRSIDWSQVGVVGGISNRTTICTTLNPGVTADQINAAITNCGAGQVVYLNAGTYNLTSGILF